MRSRPPLAVLAMGLAITSCTQPDSAAVETMASTLPTTSSVVAAAPENAAASTQPAEALVVTVDGDEPTTSSTPDQAVSTASTAAPSTASTAPTAPATSQQPTTAPPSSTTAAPTTQPPTTATTAAPTTSPPTTASGTETRPELLRLDLPTFGGGTFDTNSVAGKNVILWFWGAH